MRKGRVVYNSYSPWRFDLSKASGSYLWTKEGRKLIDFSSGWNVTNLGWNHPEIADAVIRQAGRNVYAPMWAEDEAQTAYASALTASLPPGLDAVGRATGGTEANEMALKMARSATGRSRVIGIKDSYHGQSFGTMSLGFRPEFVKAISPLVPKFTQLDFPSSDRTDLSPEDALDGFLTRLDAELAGQDVAAVLTEAGIVTGWGTASMAPAGYLAGVRALTKKYKTLLILDEVGTGFSRTGALFAMEHEGVTPDFVTLAKGISNGAGPIGAVVTSADIADATFANTTLTSTFGWTPLSCAAALETIKIHQRDQTWNTARLNGGHLVTSLKRKLAGHPDVVEIRGLGMEIGVQLKNAALVTRVVEKSFAGGLHIAQTGEDTLQLMPPLNMDMALLDEGARILSESLL